MTTILTKKKDTTGAPAPGDLTNSAGGAELAVNTFDKRLYTKDSGGNIVEIGTNPSTIDTTTVDTTNLEVTNIKAKDGTASATIANSTGVMTIASAVLTTTDINGGTIDGTTIGGASAAAGNFTTLGASSTATLNTLVSSGATLTGGSINNMAVGASTANTGAFTTLSASSTVSGTGFSNYFASPPALGGTAAAAVSSTNLSYTGTLTGGTGVVNLGSGQFYKDASGNVGIGATPTYKLDVLATASTGNVVGFRLDRSTASATNTNSILWTSGGVSIASVAGIVESSTAGGLVFSTTTASILTERMRIDSSGNVGIGTSSPAANVKLAVNGTIQIGTGTSSSAGCIFSNANYGMLFQALQSSPAQADFSWLNSAGTERMRISSTGNLLIGATTNASSPNVKLVIYHSSNGTFQLVAGDNSGGCANAPLGGGGQLFYTYTGALGSEGYTERMRIDSSGNLLVGTTSGYGGKLNVNGNVAVSNNSDCFTAKPTGNQTGFVYSATSSTGQAAYFMVNSGANESGKITCTSTSTTYATSSDYRLKENIQPMQNGLAFCRKQRPVTYDWKADGSKGSGYIAHWLQEDGAGNCVTGEKDAVDKDGKPIYQGIDTSFMVGPLNAGLNELADIVDKQAELLAQLKAELDATKAEVASLKGA